MGSMTKKEARENKLMDTLSECHRMSISEVTELLHISEASARRLFTKMQSEGKLLRVHGGVQITHELRNDYSFIHSINTQNPAKKKIGEKAAQKVQSSEQIFLDAGTTVLKMADALVNRLASSEISNLTIITNSLCLPTSLANYCDVILIGGTIRPQRRDVCGALARQILLKYSFKRVFFGADAVSENGEIMTTDPETAEINALFINRSQKAYLLADTEKFNKTSPITFANTHNITAVISS